MVVILPKHNYNQKLVSLFLTTLVDSYILAQLYKKFDIKHYSERGPASVFYTQKPSANINC